MDFKIQQLGCSNWVPCRSSLKLDRTGLQLHTSSRSDSRNVSLGVLDKLLFEFQFPWLLGEVIHAMLAWSYQTGCYLNFSHTNLLEKWIKQCKLGRIRQVAMKKVSNESTNRYCLVILNFWNLSLLKRRRMNNLCGDVQPRAWRCAPVWSCLTIHAHMSWVSPPTASKSG